LSTDRQKTVCCTTTSEREKRPSVLKILVVFFHPTARVTAVGGAEKRLAETIRIFCRQSNVEITVLESTPSVLNEPSIPCKKHLLSSSFRGNGWLGTYLEWFFWIAKAFLKSPPVFRRGEFDVIFIPNNTLPNLALGYGFSLVFRRPACVIVHHIDIPLTRAGSKDDSLYESYRSINYSKTVAMAKTLAQYAVFPLLKKVKAIIAVSNFTKKALTDIGIPDNRIFVSSNAIDLNGINKAERYSTEKVFDGAFVGRIAKEKGVFDLLEVWKKILKSKKNAKLLIIGSGLELASLERKIAANGLRDNVLIRGRCNNEELYGSLKSSKVFVFPSLFEGWGIAVAEALACGIPVVAYNIPALREVFGQCKSVFLTPARNVAQMALTVAGVLDSENKKLAENSANYAKNFSWKKVAAADLEAIFKAASKSL